MKSYVTMEQCILCQKDTGALFLDRRLKNSFDRHTTLPHSVCDKCKKKYLSKGVMLVNPHTGRLAVLKTSAFKRIFDKPVPKHRIAYTDDDVLDKLGV